MRVFVTGASGWIGSAVVPDLIAAGHEVVGLARSDTSAATLTAAGAQVVRGDLSGLDTLRMAASDADGVIHLAFIHDFARFEAAIHTDAEAVEALATALAGSGKPLVIASGTPAVPGQVATEHDAPTAPGLTAGRMATARAALAWSERGVRTSVVRLPRTVHGEGDAGFVPRLIAIARESGVSGYVGDGTNRWPAVHVTDAARLFRLALEQASPGTVLHAVSDEGVTIRDIADTIARHLSLPTASLAPDAFGFLGGILSVDQPASSTHTRALLNWHPTGPTLLDDLDKGHYFT